MGACIVGFFCPQKEPEQKTKDSKLNVQNSQIEKISKNALRLPLESNYVESSNDQEVEIVEMQLDFTNKSQDERKSKLMPKSHFEKLKGSASTNDIMDFSSLREQQHDHPIFTSEVPVRQPKIKLENGSLYEGEWFKGQKHGRGKQTWPNGVIYDVS